MIYFEIDGHEYTADINGTPSENAVAFKAPDGTVLWLHRPEPTS